MELLKMDKVNELIPLISKGLGSYGTIIEKSCNRIEVSLIFGKVDFDPFDYFNSIVNAIGAKETFKDIPNSYFIDGVRIVAFLGEVRG